MSLILAIILIGAGVVFGALVGVGVFLGRMFSDWW